MMGKSLTLKILSRIWTTGKEDSLDSAGSHMYVLQDQRPLTGKGWQMPVVGLERRCSPDARAHWALRREASHGGLWRGFSSWLSKVAFYSFFREESRAVTSPELPEATQVGFMYLTHQLPGAADVHQHWLFSSPDDGTPTVPAGWVGTLSQPAASFGRESCGLF